VSGTFTGAVYPVNARAEAARVAGEMGYPVVLKIHSPDITHKTDVGGVLLDLGTAESVSAAFDAILANARACRPDARIEGVTVQPMIQSKDAVELIVGVKRDAVFGTVMMVGMGGSGPSCSATGASASLRSTTGSPGTCSSRCAWGRC
jgi:acetyltransferase